MKTPDILLVFKKSRLEILKKTNLFSEDILDLEDLEQTHKEHYQNLEQAQNILAKLNCPFKSCYRSDLTRKMAKNRLVISFGGDGTLLDTSHYLKDSPILGVNSNPNHSVGSLCATSTDGLETILPQIFEQKIKPTKTPRIQFSIDNKTSRTLALNELLISSRNPAGTSMYVIEHNGKTEHHKSAGIWISTPSGSTGALASSGGELMELDEPKLQFKVREPYFDGQNQSKITSGYLKIGQKLKLTSKMISGHIYPDGPHKSQIFSWGSKAEISISPNSLNIFVTPEMLKKRKSFSKI